MSTPTTTPPSVEEHEEYMAKTGRSFWKSIKHKIGQAAETVAGLAKKTVHHTKHAATATADFTAQTAKVSWKGICWAGRTGWGGLKTGGRKTLWLGSGMLAGVAWGAHTLVRWVTITTTFLLSVVTMIVVIAITGVGLALSFAIILVHKLVHFVALVLSSPWIALHSRAALKEDWHLFWVGLKPRNLHITNSHALAAQTMRDRERKTQQRAARAAAATDGVPNGAKKTAAPKRRKPRTLDPSLA